MTGLPSLLETAFSGWRQRASAQSKGSAGLHLIPKAPEAQAPAPANAHLAQLVEGEIIPRLMLAHSDFQPAGGREPASGPDGAFKLCPSTTEQFVRLLLEGEADAVHAYVERLLGRGLCLDALYVDLVIPAARRLGDYWVDDTASFTDVTIALGRLQQIVRTLGGRLGPELEFGGGARSALFVAAPGEQHTLGLCLLEDLFRRSGWRTQLETRLDQGAAAGVCAGRWFDVLGLSAGLAVKVDDIKDTIGAARSASANSDLFVLVGGRLFEQQPELVTFVGADATASNGVEALLIVNKAVRRLPAHS
jgi:methanogenic corrinoid protein MtbC1